MASSPGLKNVSTPQLPAYAKGINFASQIRLYYISPDFKLSELCYDADSSSKGWFSGELSTKGYQVAPYSQIAATYLATSQLKIRYA